MRVLYMAINFLILAAVLFLVGRKTVFKMFRQRREKIQADLDAAQRGQQELELSQARLQELEQQGQQELEKLEQECRDALQEKQQQTQKLLRDTQEKVEESLKKEFEIYRRTLIKEIEGRVVDDIVNKAGTELEIPEQYDRTCIFEIAGMIKKSVGDVITTATGNALRVKVESARPIDAELSAYVTAAAGKAFGVEADKMKVSVRVLPELMGGVRFTVNDTVYDGTISNLMRTVNKSVRLDAFIVDEAKSISQAISDSISNMSLDIDVYQVGKVISVSDGICHISGLSDAMYGETVEFDNGVFGMVLDLEKDHIGCIIFGSFESVEAGDPVRRSGHVMKVPVGEALLGRVVDALGKPIDGIGVIIPDEYRPIECQAPSIPDRKSVSVPLQTGIKAIDALVPIGRGQRELIIGDRQTGKTSIAMDTIINQKGKDVICIYVAIGQKETTVAQIQDTFTKCGAMEYTTIVCADAYHSAPMQYVAPYAGSAMGEYFMYKGKDVLIVFDDLSKHAAAYREISLLLHRPSGREAYPGDVFYLHSRLLERSARLSPEAGGGSMTALPIIETQAGDISAYIPTNAISITDGQIFLESELFLEGQRPAVNVGLSVSRVGGAAQIGAMRQIAGRLRMDLAQYRELAAFSQFGSELDKATKDSIEKGKRMMALLNQPQFAPVPVERQVLAIYAVAEGYADDVNVEDISTFESELCSYFAAVYPGLLQQIATGGKMSQELMQQLKDAIAEFKENAA